MWTSSQGLTKMKLHGNSSGSVQLCKAPALCYFPLLQRNGLLIRTHTITCIKVLRDFRIAHFSSLY